MTFKLPPYLQWRDGRPRWEPGPGIRKAFPGRDLKDAGGNWLRLEAAIAAAKVINAEVTSWRTGIETPNAVPNVARKPSRTCKALWELYSASPAYLELSHQTQLDYKSKIGVFLKEFGADHVGAIAKHDMFTFWEDVYKTRGHTMANSTISAVRSMLSYGEMKGWRAPETNPARNLKISKPEPRVVCWTPSEVEAFVAKADEMQYFGVADAVVIGLHTCQRQGDVLHLEFMASENGRMRFRQGKTNARVSVPFSPALEERLEKIKARRRAGPVAELKLTGELIRDTRGRHYTRETFGKDFREVREKVAADQIGAGANEASILGKLYLDLRDTGITRLALAGATVPEIHAISGHSMKTIHDVLRHYLAIDDRLADAAIAKLKIWMEQEGIAI